MEEEGRAGGVVPGYVGPKFGEGDDAYAGDFLLDWGGLASLDFFARVYNLEEGGEGLLLTSDIGVDEGYHVASCRETEDGARGDSRVGWVAEYLGRYFDEFFPFWKL